MKVLVLGGTGYIGARLCAQLRQTGWAQPVSVSSARRAGAADLALDTRDGAALQAALQEVDAVVNCVAGNAAAIAEGARVLADAALAAGCLRIVHLSSMSVYGVQEGELTEQAPTDPTLGWYGKAKCEAEGHMQRFAGAGGCAVLLRPGCVWGPGSQLWVTRIGQWLRSGRIGDLGAAGDGWSNLVHVDDVCRAILAALRLPLAARGFRSFNLAAPDSPRWNDYFVDLALAIHATPVRRVHPMQVRLDAWLGGPPLQLARSLLARTGRSARHLPSPVTPGLLGLWQRHLRLDSTLAERQLQPAWTPYDTALEQAASWFLQHEARAA